MILQALTHYYEVMAEKGKMSLPGWGIQKVSYALELNENGELISLHNLKTEQQIGKKVFYQPREMELPAAVKRSSGISPNFLWDNSSYILGIDEKGKEERSKGCFRACTDFHRALLSQCDSIKAVVLLRFFENWDPDIAREHPALQEELTELMSGSNIIFLYNGSWIHDDKSIQDVWTKYHSEKSEGEKGYCLVTGEKTGIERIHPAIKGMRGVQSSGGALVSFNAPAFCSYDLDQGMNAPVGTYASFAYTTALNRLIAEKRRRFQVGDMTILMWPDNGEEAGQDLMELFLAGEESEKYNWEDLLSLMEHLVRGEDIEFEETRISPDEPFFILGLSPNAARISVRFFLKSSFGKLAENIRDHYERLRICDDGRHHKLSMYYLMASTVRPTATDKTPSPRMSGEFLRSVIEGKPYPTSILTAVNMRIRAEHEISRERAALIKAYYLKNENRISKEVLTVALNKESEYVPYLLGRLFSVLEGIQSAASPGINTTIRDRYFSSACATPSVVFPTLINLSQKHMSKLKEGGRIFYSKQITEIMGKMGECYPNHLSLPEQGAFQLGYYHQSAERYQSKDKEDTTNE